MITDSTGNTVATYTYDPYGNNTATGTYAATNVMRYQASQQDTVASNFNNPTSTNRYTYAGDNPIENWDHTGKFDITKIATGVAGGVGAVMGTAALTATTPVWVPIAIAIVGGSVAGAFIGCGIQSDLPSFCGG